MTDCGGGKRGEGAGEKEKETLCVNNHGHQASPEENPGRPMSLVRGGQVDWIRYKSSHFEKQNG